MKVAARDQSDFDIIKQIEQGNIKAYELLFRKYYKELCLFSLKFVRQQEIAEEIVQDIFIVFWEKEKGISLQVSVKAYLYTAVKNSSLNYMKSLFAKQSFDRDFLQKDILMAHPSPDEIGYKELENLVAEAIAMLPERCKIIFSLSRNAGLSYQEIADQLNISVKTVEAQMSIAIKKLKGFLYQHWDTIIVLIIMFNCFLIA
jgi:RNA polymerase sigma-70 factor, ECF subfamily